ncbi:MAG: hypothetical protein R2882_13965 [Gemmatimonadales bacterium]
MAAGLPGLVLLEVAAALVVGLGAGLAISWTDPAQTSLVYGITAADLPSYLGACVWCWSPRESWRASTR